MMRILMANEPRSHREVFAGALRLEDGTLRVCTSDAGRSPDPDPGIDVLLQFVDRSEEQIRTARQTQDTPHRFGGLR